MPYVPQRERPAPGRLPPSDPYKATGARRGECEERGKDYQMPGPSTNAKPVPRNGDPAGLLVDEPEISMDEWAVDPSRVQEVLEL